MQMRRGDWGVTHMADVETQQTEQLTRQRQRNGRGEGCHMLLVLCLIIKKSDLLARIITLSLSIVLILTLP